MQRARSRAKLDRIEQEDMIFFNRVRDTFISRAKQHKRYKIIDASLTIPEVQAQLSTVMLNLTHSY